MSPISNVLASCTLSPSSLSAWYFI